MFQDSSVLSLFNTAQPQTLVSEEIVVSNNELPQTTPSQISELDILKRELAALKAQVINQVNNINTEVSHSVEQTAQARSSELQDNQFVDLITNDLNSFNTENQAGQLNPMEIEVNKVLSNLPVFVFSNPNVSTLDKLDLDKGGDASILNFKNSTKATDVTPSNVVVIKTKEQQIIDGDIEGRFAGPNASYPIASAEDALNALAELSNKSDSQSSRIRQRVMSIAKKFKYDKAMDKETKQKYGFSLDIDQFQAFNMNTDKCVDTNILNLTVTYASELDFQAFTDSENGKMMLKVPAGIIGKWVHPEYGEVEFNQENFDQAIDNFNANVLGYEPTLNVGHYIGETDEQGQLKSVGDAPTDGICVELYQEGNVLFTHYECLNSQTYTNVLNKKYRRSSSELSMNFVDRRNGRQVGMTLVGMALTNQPFITGMPTVVAFSHDKDKKANFTTSFECNLYTQEDQNMTTPSTSETVTTAVNPATLHVDTVIATPAVAFSAPAAIETGASADVAMNQLKLTFETAMLAQEKRYTALVEKQMSENKALNEVNLSLQSRIASLEEQKNKELLDSKLAIVDSLELSEEDKAQYRAMFTNKTLGSEENETIFLQTITKNFSATGKHSKFTQQFGNTNLSVKPDASNQPSVNVYQHLIDRNKAAAK